MKDIYLKVNFTKNKISYILKDKKKSFNLFSENSFNIVKKFWEEYCWHFKYTYQFTWLGFPVIQLADDLIQVQELIYKEKPDFIVETGIARGGSIIFYSSICKLINHGKVIGVDIKIRKKNKELLDKSFLKNYFKLIESDSNNKKLILKLKNLLKNKKTLVILDSNHEYEHVLKELINYGEIITKGSFILVTDGIVDTMTYSPRRKIYNKNGGPLKALKEYLNLNKKFKKMKKPIIFNNSLVKKDIRLTHFPNGLIKKIK